MADVEDQGPSPAPSQRSTQRSILKSAAVITLLTFISRLLGLFREQVRSYYLGTGTGSDAFGLASMIPNLFRRLLGEGAMTAAFVPVFTQYQNADDRAELNRFLSAFFSVFVVVLLLICGLGMVASDWLIRTFFSSGFGLVEGKIELTADLTMLLFPYLGLASLAALVQAVLNTYGVFAPSAFTPILLNVATIAGTILLHPLFGDASYAMAIGFLVGGVFQLAFQLPWFWKRGLKVRPSFNWNHPGVKELFRVFAPGIIAAGIYQVNVFVSEIIAASLSPGSIASLQYSIRLQELVLGVFVISMTTVILPTLSKQHFAGDSKGFERTNLFSLEVLALVTIPASVALIVLRRPIVSLLFQQGAFDSISVEKTSFAVMFHAVGIYFIAVSRSLTQSFFAKKDLKRPMYVALCAFVVNISVCYFSSIYLDNGGIALGNSASAAASAAVLYFLMRSGGMSLGGWGHGLFLARVLVASLVMAGVAMLLMWALPWEGAGKLGVAWRLSLYGGGGIVSFVAAGLLLFPQWIVPLGRGLKRRMKR